MNTIPEHTIERTVTKSGFSIINVTVKNYPISTSSVWVNAGSSKDPATKQGLSHFFEHLLFTKTEKFPDRQERLNYVEKNGLLFNAYTTLQTQHYFYVHTESKSEVALDLLIDGLSNSNFSETDLEKEREIILNEEAENHNDPASYIWRLANKGLWGSEELGQDFYGDSNSISSITKRDMNDFYQKFFTKENVAFVFINSDLPLEKQEEKISSCNLTSSHYSTDSKHYTEAFSSYIFEKKPTPNTQLAFSFLTLPVCNTKERVIQELLANYLASGWTSVLIQKLRIEKNLTYWVSQETAYLEKNGYLRFSLSTRNETVDEVLNIFNDTITEVKSQLIPSNVLNNHKTKLIADFTRESVNYSWLMVWYGYSSLLTGNVASVSNFQQIISTIEPAEIRSFAQKYFVEEKFSLAMLSTKKFKPRIFTFQ